MDICLDSNVFTNDPNFFEWIAENDVKAYLPSVAFMELSYYQMKKFGGSVEKFIQTLGSLDIEILPFDRGLALIGARSALSGHDLSSNARDYAIGAYAYKRKIPMITNNKKHFKWLSEVYTPAEFMNKQ
jgi:predicted nucleic acid-binding protein